ncbi:MAG: molybdate ABC transporter substrate-binding protein [Desulfurococcaceae archaeon]
MHISNRHLYAVIFVLGFITVLGISVLYQQLHGASEKREEIVVFAGAAAAPVYKEVARAFESKYNVKVTLHLGGSGTLLSTIEITQTGDVYIPGSPEFLLAAREKGVVDFSEHPPKVLAYLVPAIIVQKGNPKNISKIEDLTKPGVRVGLGDPEVVCIGLYAKEMLEKIGIWEGVYKNIVVYAASCEHVAQLIYTGAVDAVIGWHVFYYWNPEKSDIVWIEPSKITRIGYIAGAVTKFARNREWALRFLDFLASEEAQGIWRKYGYFPTLEEAKKYAPSAEVEELT